MDEGKLALHGWIYDMGLLSLTVYDASEDRFVPALTTALAQ
jgi:hypothetical protein